MLRSIVIVLLIPLVVWSLIVAWSLWRGFKNQTLRRQLVGWLLLHGVLAGVIGMLLLDVRPQVTTEPLTTADKVLIRKVARPSATGDCYELSLDEGQIARGARTAADLVHVELHSRLELDSERQCKAIASLRLPARLYLNVAAEGRAAIHDGELELDLTRLRVGRLTLPGPMRRMTDWLVTRGIDRLPLTAKTLSAIELAEIRPGKIDLKIRRQQHLTQHFARQLQSDDLSETADVAMRVVRRWVRHCEQVDAPAPQDRDLQFVAATRRLNQWTREFRPQWTAARQNRAMLLAGAIAFGHPRLADLVGGELDKATYDAIKRHGGRLNVHRRRDLVQHFWVSAGLAELASSRVSSVAGLSKEEMDSGAGGSGFSFADLLADRAGVRFAEIAKGGDVDASRLQDRLATDWRVEDLIPTIAGLPEGISEESFTADYGGPGGQRFGHWSAEIDRRIASAPLLR
jgi:hypothetical protein